MTRDFNILLTFAVFVDGSRWKGFLSHEAPPKQTKGGASVKGAPPASLLVQCGAESLLLAGCSSAEPVSSSALQKAKLIKSSELCHRLMASGRFFTDESILIWHTAFDDGESLSEKFVGNGDHGEFPGFPPFSESRINFFTCRVVSACGPCGNIEKSAQGGVSVAVDMAAVVDRCARLLISRRKSEIPGKLFGVVEIGEPCCGYDECRGESDPDALDGCEQLELAVELSFRHIGQFLLQIGDLLLQRSDYGRYGSLCGLVDYWQHIKRVCEVFCGGKLFLELSKDGTLLFEEHEGLRWDFVRLRPHPLPVKRYEPRVSAVCLGHCEHGLGEVLYLQRIFHADRYSGFGKQIEEQRAVRSRGFHDAVALRRKRADELADVRARVAEIPDVTTLVGRIGDGERGFADVDSDVPHNITIYKNHLYISDLHCEMRGQETAQMNYPVSDVKARGHNIFPCLDGRMKTLPYSVLMVALVLITNLTTR